MEEPDRVRAMLEAVAEDVDDPLGADGTLEPGEELATGGARRVEREGVGELRLGGAEEAAELDEVDAVLAVVVGRVAEEPAGAAGDGERGVGGDVGGERRSGRPVMARTMRASRAFSDVSVLMRRPPPGGRSCRGRPRRGSRRRRRGARRRWARRGGRRRPRGRRAGR